MLSARRQFPEARAVAAIWDKPLRPQQDNDHQHEAIDQILAGVEVEGGEEMERRAIVSDQELP